VGCEAIREGAISATAASARIAAGSEIPAGITSIIVLVTCSQRKRVNLWEALKPGCGTTACISSWENKGHVQFETNSGQKRIECQIASHYCILHMPLQYSRQTLLQGSLLFK